MPWNSDLFVVATTAGLIVLAPTRADAAPCDGDLAISLVTTRFLMIPEPTAAEGLGLELHGRGPSVTWGHGCTGARHQVDAVALEIPDYGVRDDAFVHGLTYRYQWHTDRASFHVGVRGLTQWIDNLRFATPLAGVTVEPAPRLLVRAELASAGLFVAALDRAPHRPTDDLALEVDAVWPAGATTRGELRARARHYRLDDQRRLDDLTVTAGVGLALAARNHQRGLPGFLGLAVRRGDDTRVFVVAELTFGLANQ